MSRYPPRGTNSVSLFPFLAVLVCAMGALIFLLVVTTRRARLQAWERAERLQVEQTDVPVMSDAPAPTVRAFRPSRITFGRPEPARANSPSYGESTVGHSRAVARVPARDPVETWQDTIVYLTERRHQHVQRLETLRARVAKMQQLVREQASRLAENRQKLGGLQQAYQQAASSGGTVQEQQIRLASLIAETEQRLEQARLEKNTQGSQYAFVPYDGISGTTRRPILIECTGDSLRFVPEDVVIRPPDLVGFGPEMNPLLAGAQALVHYWTAWNYMQKDPDAEPRPYVLLIVRPSGGGAFYIARKFLENLGQPFGYELVEDDFSLDLPEADPKAREVCRKAIDEVLTRREAVKNEIVDQLSQRGLRLRRTAAGFRVEKRDTARPRDWSARPPTGGLNESPDFASTEPRLGGGSPKSPQGKRLLADKGDGISSRPGRPLPGSDTPKLEELPEKPSLGIVPDEDSDSEPAIAHSGLPPVAPADLPLDDSAPSLRNLRNRKGFGLSHGRAFLGFERNLKVYVQINRMIVGDEEVVPIDPGISTRDLLERTLQAIDKHARGWGKPPADSYWVPRLQFEVSPGGNQHYERLREPLKEWGLYTTVKFRLDTPDPVNRSEFSHEPGEESD